PSCWDDVIMAPVHRAEGDVRGRRGPQARWPERPERRVPLVAKPTAARPLRRSEAGAKPSAPDERESCEARSPRLVLTSQLAARLLKELLEAFKRSASVEEAKSTVGASWGFHSSAEMTRCIEAQANASLKP
ncbi:unnamed protein product, partial [Cladocopium goreaui]